MVVMPVDHGRSADRRPWSTDGGVIPEDPLLNKTSPPERKRPMKPRELDRLLRYKA